MSERFSLYLTRGAEKEWGLKESKKRGHGRCMNVSDGKDDDGL